MKGVLKLQETVGDYMSDFTYPATKRNRDSCLETRNLCRSRFFSCGCEQLENKSSEAGAVTYEGVVCTDSASRTIKKTGIDTSNEYLQFPCFVKSKILIICFRNQCQTCINLLRNKIEHCENVI